MISFEELEKDQRFQNASEEQRYGVLTKWASDYLAPAREDLSDEDFAQVEHKMGVFVKQKHSQHSPSIENNWGKTTLSEDNIFHKAADAFVDTRDYILDNAKQLTGGHLDSAIQTGTAYQAIKQEAFKQGFTEERIKALNDTWIDELRNPHKQESPKDAFTRAIAGPQGEQGSIRAQDGDKDHLIVAKMKEQFHQELAKMPQKMKDVLLNKDYGLSDEYLQAERDYALLMMKYQEQGEQAELLHGQERLALEKILSEPKALKQRQKNAQLAQYGAEWMKNTLHHDINQDIEENYFMGGGRAMIALHEKAKDDLAENEDYQRLAVESEESLLKEAIFGASGAVPQLAITTGATALNPALGLASAGQMSSGDIAQTMKDSGLSAKDAISKADKYTMAYSALEYIMPAKLVGKLGKKESFKMFKELGDGFVTELATGAGQATIKEVARLNNDEDFSDNFIEVLADPEARARIAKEAVQEGLAGGTLNAPFSVASIAQSDAMKKAIITRKVKGRIELKQHDLDFLMSKNYSHKELVRMGFDKEVATQIEKETMQNAGLVPQEVDSFDGRNVEEQDFSLTKEEKTDIQRQNRAGMKNVQAQDFLDEEGKKGDGELQKAIDENLLSKNVQVEISALRDTERKPEESVVIDETPKENAEKLSVSEPISEEQAVAQVSPESANAPKMIPLSEIKHHPELENFKEGADHRGVVDEIQGTYEPRNASPIVVWQDKKGDKFVVTGRHRKDLAERSGESEIISYVIKEEDGVTLEQARILDAEMNIRDEQGSSKDYAKYFKLKKMNRQEAESSGLLGRKKQQDAFELANAPQGVWNAFNDGKITASQSAGIVRGAGGDSGIQRALLKEAISTKHGGDYLKTYGESLQLAERLVDSNEFQMDLFGESNAVEVVGKKLVDAYTKRKKELNKDLDVVSTAKNKGGSLKLTPEKARELGITRKNDKKQLAKAQDLLKAKLQHLDTWKTDKALQKSFLEGEAVDYKAVGLESASSFADMQKEVMSNEFEFSNSHSQMTGFEAHQFAQALGSNVKLKEVVKNKSATNGVFFSGGSRRIELRKDLAIGPRIGAMRADSTKEEIQERLEKMARELAVPGEKLRAKRGQGKESRLMNLYFIDPNYKNKVYLHEVGHLVDSLDDDNIKRGNILGSLQGVHKVMKSVIASKPDGSFNELTKKEISNIEKEARKIAKGDNEMYKAIRSDMMNREYAFRDAVRSNEIMDELKAFTMFWKPFDDKDNPDYTKYRYSAREVYADFFSGLLNNPAAVRRIAPRTVEIFNNYLINKPNVHKEYTKLLQRMESKDYREKLGKDVFEKMRQSRQEQDKIQQEKRTKAEDKRSFLEKLSDLKSWMSYSFVGKAAVIKKHNYSKNTLHQLEAKTYDDGKVIVYNRMVRDLTDRLGYLKDYLHEYMIANRVIHERNQLFNPEGLDAESAQLLLDDLRDKLGQEGLDELAKAQDEYFELRKKHVLPFVEEAGLANDTLKDYMRDNKFYAHFLVDKEYFGNLDSASMGNGLYAQTGTLEGVADVFASTVEYDSKLLRRASMNKARLALAKDLSVDHPPATKLPDGSFREPDNRGKAPYQHQALLEYIEDGERKAVIVHRDVMDFFDRQGHALQKAADALSNAKTPFYLAWITLNLGFTARNMIRDFKATNKRFGKMPYLDNFLLLGEYLRSGKEAYDDAFRDKMSEAVREMYENSELIPGEVAKAQFFAEEHAGDEVKFTYEREKKRGLKRVVGWMEDFQKMNERWAKIAGKRYLQKKRPDLKGAELSHAVRSLVGSPDFLNAGAAAPLFNPIFMFSSASIKGTQAEIEGFKGNKLAWTAKFMSEQGLRIFFLMNVLNGNALEWFGIDEDDEDNWLVKMREVLLRIPYRDLLTSNIIPFGMNEEGEARYIKTPSSHLAQALQHIIWSAFDDHEQGVVEGTMSMNPFSGFNPIIITAMNAIEVAKGDMPTDGFGRNLMRQKDIDRGGWHKWSEFGQESFNEFFRDYGKFSTLKDEDKGKGETLYPWEAYPKGLIKRFWRTSDQGLKDRKRMEKRKKRIERAKSEGFD